MRPLPSRSDVPTGSCGIAKVRLTSPPPPFTILPDFCLFSVPAPPFRSASRRTVGFFSFQAALRSEDSASRLNDLVPIPRTTYTRGPYRKLPERDRRWPPTPPTHIPTA